MKTFTFLLAAFSLCFGLSAQEHYVINFSGVSADPESILVKNLTQNTELTMQGGQTLHLIIKGVGVDDISGLPENQLAIYPNPFEHSCNIKFKNFESGRVSMQLFDLSGRVIHNFSDELQSGKHTFRLEGLSAGSFFLSVQTKTDQISGKFVVTGNSKGQISLQHIDEVPLKSILFNSNPSKTPTEVISKSGKSVVEMDFWPGDAILFTGISSGFDNISIFDTPDEDKTYIFDFGSSWPVGHVHCGGITAVVDVVNPITGKTWMDRNLGASSVATSSTDEAAYGDLYQWGRLGDGHQCRASITTTVLSSTDDPQHGSFILASESPHDWRSPQEDVLWQGIDGTNNPCPAGYKIPTDAELHSEQMSWESNDAEGAFASPLKLPLSGFRNLVHGSILEAGTGGDYRSSTVEGIFSRRLHFADDAAVIFGYFRASGGSVRCIKDVEPDPILPEVTTNAITEILATSATSGGYVSHDGFAVVEARGVVWSQTEYPTIDDNDGFTTDGEGTGNYTSFLTGLESSTSYYLRAYASNIAGTAYGEQLSFETLGPPVVSTETVTDIANNSALAGGTVTHDGGSPVTNRGVVWSTAENPSIDNNLGLTPESIGLGEFVSGINGLEKNSSYYVRAFASNIFGTSYGENVQFATSNEDYDWPEGFVNCGFETEVITIVNPKTGDTWMDRNIGSSRVATSSTDSESYGYLFQWGRFADGHQCRTSATTSTLSSVNQPNHGNFIAGMDSPYDWRSPQNDGLWQGYYGSNNPCPDGFRVPTQAELTSERLSWNSNNSGGAFGSPLKLSNGGYRISSNAQLLEVSTNGHYWSSTVSANLSWRLSFSATGAHLLGAYRASGFSVRCIKEKFELLPEVNTSEISDISSNTAVGGGEVIHDGGSPVSARGVVWGKTPNPTIHENEGITQDGLGLGVFHSSLEGLEPESLYYVKAYATNDHGTGYGNQVSFESLQVELYTPGTVHCDEPTDVVDVTNPTTGKVWMDRNLGASQVATSSNDQDSYGDMYQWGRFADGHQCRNSETTTVLSESDIPGNANFILSPDGLQDWRNPQNNDLWQGLNGINNPCPIGYRIPTIAEFESERESWESNNASGAFASPLKLPLAGMRSHSNGNLFYLGVNGSYWASTVSGSLSRYLLFTSTSASSNSYHRAAGFSVRCIKVEPEVASLVTTEVTDITSTTATSGGDISLDGGAPIVARGVVWSQNESPTVEDNEGITSDGEGLGAFSSNLTGLEPSTNYHVRAYAINSAGTAYGDELTFETDSDGSSWPAGYVHCDGVATKVVEVLNPTTGRIWMNRNLGASQVATSNTDEASYGDLFQWGRLADGHHCRNSGTTSTLSDVDVPGHNLFILAPINPHDWRSPQNGALWQGIGGINNPCPEGFRLPTEAEFNDEQVSWTVPNASGAFSSPLKWSLAGSRLETNGSISLAGTHGRYWSSTVSGAVSRFLFLASNNANVFGNHRALGYSVRCIKDLRKGITKSEE